MDTDEDRPLSIEERVQKILRADDKHEFLSFVKWVEASNRPQVRKFAVRPPELLRAFCMFKSVNCATALLNGDTGQTVDINVASSEGLFPLHHAARYCSPEITELYLFYGARTDLRSCNHKLPLNLLVESFCFFEDLKQWTPKQSIFKLLILLCLPQMQNALETLELVAWKTEETEEEILRYARGAKLVELAALLLVAHKKLAHPVTTISECISTQITTLTLEESAGVERSKLAMLEDMKTVLMAGQKLLQVFERAGDAIRAYIQRDKTGGTNEQSITEVTILLQQAGFVLKPQDTDFSDIRGLHLSMIATRKVLADYGVRIIDSRPPPKDLGMPHYLSSGHRWPCKVFNEKAREIPMPVAFVPNERRSFHTVRVLKASSAFKFPSAVGTEVKNTVKGVEIYLPNALVSKPWVLVASVIKRGLRGI